MLKVAERWFERRTMGEGVTWIWEPHLNPFIRCNIWHVRGRDRDLIVDTGSGLSPLRREIADLVARPLAAIATHIHYDHVGGLHEFDERMMHHLEAPRMNAYREFHPLRASDFPSPFVPTCQWTRPARVICCSTPARLRTGRRATMRLPRPLRLADSRKATPSIWAIARSRSCTCPGTRPGALVYGSDAPEFSFPA